MATNDQMVLELRADISQMKTQLKNVEKGLNSVEKTGKETSNSLVKNFKSAGTLIKGYLTGRIAMGMKNIMDEQSKLMSQFRALEQMKGYAQISGQMERMTEITGGLATKLQVVGSVNKALAFGIDLSDGRLERLIKTSQKTALIMGTDLKSAFDDLIVGVSRESKQILDNNGIQLTLNETLGAYAEKLGKTTSELTKAERQTAILNEALKQMENNTKNIKLEKTLTPWQRLMAKINVQVEDWKQSFATGVNVILDYEGEIDRALEQHMEGYDDILEKKELSELQTWAQSRAEAVLGTEITDNIRKEAKLREEKKKTYDYMVKRQAEYEKDVENYYDEMSVRGKTTEQEAFGDEVEVEKQREKDDLKFAYMKSNLKKRQAEKEKAIEKEKQAEKRRLETQKGLAKEFIQLEMDKKITEFDRYEDYADYLKSMEFLTKQAAENDIATLREWINKKKFETAREKQVNDERIANMKSMFKDIGEAVKNREKGDENVGIIPGLVSQNKKALKETEKDWKDFENRVGNITNILGNQVTGTFDDMYQAMIEGNELNTKEMLKNFLIQGGGALVTDGAVNMWKGLGKTVFGDPSGPALMGVGAAEMAAGYGMGYVGKNISVPGGSDAGGGATETNKGSNGPQTINIQMQNSIYGSKSQAVSDLRDVIVTVNRQGGIR